MCMQTNCSLGKHLHSLSRGQSPATHYAPSKVFEVPHHHFDHTHIDIVGPLLPSQGYINIYPHHIGLLHQMARINTIEGGRHWDMCHSTTSPLDCLFQHAIGLNFWLRFPVHIKVMGHTNVTFGNQTEPHNCILSPGKWLGGTISSTLKNCHQSKTYQPQLVKCTTMGIAGHPYTPPKEDLKCSSIELVFGAPMTVMVTSLLQQWVLNYPNSNYPNTWLSECLDVAMFSAAAG